MTGNIWTDRATLLPMIWSSPTCQPVGPVIDKVHLSRMEEVGELSFGFRDYWRVAYERYAGFFDEARELQALIKKLDEAPLDPVVLEDKRQLIIVVRSL